MRETGLSPLYKTYEHQRCFMGYSREARWSADLKTVCQEVLQKEFNLEPWYADERPDPTRTLRDKVVEMIANTRYGIYDLSYWRNDDKSEWMMARNVFIELGIAITFNRPILLLRHAKNEEAGLKLPHCLEVIQDQIVVFSGKKTLKDALRERLPQWINISPENDWWNRYCTFGNRICQYREAYPRLQYRKQHELCCHISDGQDKDRLDFRDVIESVLECYDDVTFIYLDNVSLTEGYNYLLCTYCQTVRSNPFAIYRITPKTTAETFIALGMSLALEKQFSHKIPTILLAGDPRDVPSLLAGYDVCIGQNDEETKASLQKFMPVVIQEVRKRIWKPKPLPFIEIVPWSQQKPAPANESLTEQEEPNEHTGLYNEITEMETQERVHCDRVIEQTTPRQLEVLRAFARGLRPKEVAHELNITISTVDIHKTALLMICRNEWNVDSSKPLSYHFLRSKFANHFNFEMSADHPINVERLNQIALMEAQDRTRCDWVVKASTPREQEVLRAFAGGLSQQQVAEKLNIKVGTVDAHKTKLLNLCREAWNIGEDTRLGYHFLYKTFANYFVDSLTPLNETVSEPMRVQDYAGIAEDYQHYVPASQGSDSETIQNDPELVTLAARLEAVTPVAAIDPAFKEALRDKLLRIQEEHVVHASTEEILEETEKLLAHESTSEKSKETIRAIPIDEILTTREEQTLPREKTGLSTIWFIRNGESESDAGLPTSSPAKVRLTERGLNQAECIARSITKQPSLIITSSSMLAKQTALATMQRYPSVLQEVWPVHEFTYLSLMSEASSTVEDRRPLVDAFWEQSNPFYVDGEGAESFTQFMSRVYSVMERLRYSKEDLIVVFSHEQFIRAAWWLSLFKLTNMDSNSMRRFRDFLTSFSMPHGSIVRAQSQGAEINWGNISTSHLL